ncbi:exodeoxyribonuclease V subunit gamma [Photobacterium sp. CCB-ST2H9]|uniref:exodeoxyribonuclease V subunit gamma n=1 Tax=Photobacterium sp. CCB-ST2H9 TaxID=2912855 RepID=UPI002004E173|nr:exodeoxyribonuclease V subunit gamma [Photobacterium sp. CCB-ST2H9]UTM57862.1 exodeoxyribonuclease V subunit gamma [Photobacterium sp. CCB-ST2H9]
MFTVYHSNQLDLLKSLLVELVRRDPLADPFIPEHILVQSPGMSQWLKLELAQSLGVAANIAFPLPATFIWDMFTKVLPDVPARSAFNKEAMTWSLMKVLPGLLEQPEFAPLKRYLAEDDDQQRRYQLSAKIADIFDQYLVYRPEWIQAWESGVLDPELTAEHPWQPILWQALYDHILSQGQSPYHRANLYEHFIESLNHAAQSGTALPDTLPKRLFVFGISALPPRYMDALAALGQHIDVHLMFTNPCRHYWGDVRDRKYLARLAARQRQQVIWQDEHSEPVGDVGMLKGSLEQNLVDEKHQEAAVGNTLLASLGKLGRDNLYLLSELEAFEVDAFVDIPADSLLHAIQSDILQLEDRVNDQLLADSQHKMPLSADDRSLSVHVCHSPMREVEVLHDNLLAMLDANSELSPRDIVVMVADINAYSPYIQAVFGNAPAERYLPFSISDRSADQENPVLLAFLRLLDLPNSRCHASELTEMLEVPAIMNRYGLDAERFLQVKAWIEEAGIRWGLDGDTAREFALPDQKQNTWLFGLQRMLLGYAMPQQAGLYQGMLAYDEVQGMEAELAGQLSVFVEQLIHYRKVLNQPHSASGWFAVLNQLLDDFFVVDTEGELVLRLIREKLQQLEQQLKDAGYGDRLTPAIMRDYLNDKLGGERISQRFLAGQINFCTLMPMRSIPFQVVCLLGMNDGVYPRTIAPEGFDLMVGRQRAGDRSRRDDDRYLFLEAMLSAQQQLYISYVGRSIQDNSEQMPSVLLSELLEYCQQGFCLTGDESLSPDDSAARLLQQLVRHHPLTPFSPQAFLGATPSYAAEWLSAARREPVIQDEFLDQPLAPVALEALSESTGTSAVMELAELQRFWRLPTQYFFNRRLKVYFNAAEGAMADDEPFALDGLQSYRLRENLLMTLLEAKEQSKDQSEALAQFQARQQAAGSLPIGAFGELTLAQETLQILPLAEQISSLLATRTEDPEIDLPLETAVGGIRLQGWLRHRTAEGLVHFRPGKIRAQDMLQAWMEHLALAAQETQAATHLLGIDTHLRLKPVDAEYARDQLTALIDGYLAGQSDPLPYFPRTVLSGLEALQDKSGNWLTDEDTLLKAQTKMAAVFQDSYLLRGEGSNVYIARVWPQWQDDLAADVMAWGERVLKPVLMHLEAVD